jgi:hypothetical protein
MHLHKRGSGNNGRLGRLDFTSDEEVTVLVTHRSNKSSKTIRLARALRDIAHRNNLH